jgi:hypothetical protein
MNDVNIGGAELNAMTSVESEVQFIKSAANQFFKYIVFWKEKISSASKSYDRRGRTLNRRTYAFVDVGSQRNRVRRISGIYQITDHMRTRSIYYQLEHENRPHMVHIIWLFGSLYLSPILYLSRLSEAIDRHRSSINTLFYRAF